MKNTPPERGSPEGASRRVLRLLGALVVLAASGVAGLLVAQQLGPERLRREIEARLGEATGAPSRLPALEVRLGLPVEFVARGLSVWDGALRVEELTARVSVAAALVGELRVTRLEADGLLLSLRGGPGEAASPPWLASAGSDRDAEEGAGEGVAAGMAWLLRGALARPLLADRIQVRGGRVELHWARESGPLEIALDQVNGELRHSLLLDQSALQLRARIEHDGLERGRFELEAERNDGDQHDVGLALSDLDLALLGEWIPPEVATARGQVSGVAGLSLPGPDEPATLDFELLARDLKVAADSPLWASPRASLRGRLEASPDRLQLLGGRVVSDPLELNLQGSLTRPVGANSELDVIAGAGDVDVEHAPALLDVIPAMDGDTARGLLAAIDSGRLSAISLSGAGRFPDWRNALQGRVGSLRRPLRLQATVADLQIRLDRDDTIDQAGFRLDLNGDQLTVSKARGLREGHPLPLLDFELEGLSHLLGADLARRVPETDEVVLAGLPLLLSLFEPDPEKSSKFRSPHVEVQLARLAHPLLLWPMRDVAVSVDGRESGLTAEIRRATWAGLPLHGQLGWSDDPTHLTAKVVLGPAAKPGEGGTDTRSAPSGSAAPAPGEDWSRGTFEIGRLESSVWSHERLTGDFRARGTKLKFAGLEGRLLPRGSVRARGEIDLGDAGSLPYRFEVDGRELDAGALLSQVGLGEGLASGSMTLRGEIRDRYVPGGHPLANLSGRLEVLARDGEVRHDMPAVLALTLASDIFRLKPNTDTVRYDTCQATLEAEEGVVRTTALELDGPDVRLFGSGTLDLGHPPHPIDAEVAVFLFRPVDQALGSIPIVGSLMLGESQNLLAAYFKLRGPWNAPNATAQPLRSFYTGPMRMVGELPGVMRRGVEALGDAITPLAPKPQRGWRGRRGASPDVPEAPEASEAQP